MENNNMSQVIAELSKIEAAAARIQNQMEEEKSQYAMAVEQKKKEFDEQLEKETEDKLAKLKVKLETEKVQELYFMREQIVEKTELLKAAYDAHGERWADEIVEKVIKE